MTFAPMEFALTTERLTLRLRDVRDLDVTMQLHDERRPDPAPRRPWEPWDRDEVHARLIEQHAAAPARGFGLLALDRRAEGDTIGYCGVVAGHLGTDEPEVAFELLQSAHGRGYATEAVRAVVGAAFATGRSRLWASVRPWNAPSFAALERVGFVRDHAITDEWGELAMCRLDAPYAGSDASAADVGGHA